METANREQCVYVDGHIICHVKCVSNYVQSFQCSYWCHEECLKTLKATFYSSSQLIIFENDE